MSIKQIQKIKNTEKNAIMKSIFQNYTNVKNTDFSKTKKLNQKDYNRLQLFALTESIISIMDPEEFKTIRSVFIEDKKIENENKLNYAINKFVFYLLA